MAYRPCEHRNDDGNHRLDTLHERSRFDAATSSRLCVRNGFRLASQSGQEPQCEAHHQCDLLRVHAYFCEGFEQGFERVGDGRRRGGGEEHHSDDNDRNESAGVQYSDTHTVVGDWNRSDVRKNIAGLYEEHIEQSAEHEQCKEHVNRFEQLFHADA